MFIDDNRYDVDLHDIYMIRKAMHLSVYSKPDAIECLKAIILDKLEGYLPIQSIEFENSRFTVKIGKGAAKQTSSFSHHPSFYYEIIAPAFSEFIDKYRSTILVETLEQYDTDDEEAIARVTEKLQTYGNLSSELTNICNISCMSNNVLVIDL